MRSLAIRARHHAWAIGVLLLLAIPIAILGATGEAGITPTLSDIFRTPLFKPSDTEAPKRRVPEEQVADTPELVAALPAAQRLSGRPHLPAQAKEAPMPPSQTAERHLAPSTNRAPKVTVTVQAEEEPRPEPPVTETEEPALDLEAATREHESLMQVGSQLIEDGRKAPRLRLTYRLDDLERLVAGGQGHVLFEHRGQFFRVRPTSRSVRQASDFIVATDDFRKTIPNRCIKLDGDPALTGLRRRLAQKIGATSASAVKLAFYPSDDVHRILWAKQLAALHALGIDLDHSGGVTTEGDLVLHESAGVLYVVRHVYAGAKRLPFRDPDALIADRNP